ncbi:hypothetical protein PVAND_008782 [Polypedilum vanderplanki]|uniref:Serine protease n=1 Tax=Polypedilum vanderplanki TaxID=319348 RepID=A0A9J6CBU2_POLVA|nr:hypothetical protein PVAND_008782 [Polypedilum vanderplanki]
MKIFLLIFLSILKTGFAQYFATCDGLTLFNTAGQVAYVNWPEEGISDTFCTYIFKAPINYYLRANISYYLAGTSPSCNYNQYVAVSIDNMPNWDGYNRFCGYRSNDDPLVVNSIANELKLGISSSYSDQFVSVSIEILPLEQGNCDCSWNPRRRIINGVDASPNEFIAHVGFKATVGSFQQSFCGGTIISQFYAITAAHCIANINDIYGISNVIMRVGSFNITAPLEADTVYAEEYLLESAVHHENYNNPQNANDIGIVKTSNYIRFTRGVGPACLPFLYEGFFVPDGSTLTAVGFGSTEYALDAEYDTNSWILKKVALYVESSLANDCTNDDVVCTVGAQYEYTRGDSCTRDSGGAVYGYINNRYFDFGIISRGVDCGGINSHSYNMYTVYYLNWIQSQTENIFLCDLR